MIDNDIKRKVAQDIRENYRRDGFGYTPVSAVNVAHAIGLHEGPLLDDLVFWARLADLIEPERTCHVDKHAEERDGRYVWVYTFSCGHEFESYWYVNPRYCLFCGAKVVGS